MIQPLRKVHRRLFLLLAIALPLFFFAGLRARHRQPVRKAVGRKPVSVVPMSGSAAIFTAANDGATK
jgi:hypothetical protein